MAIFIMNNQKIILFDGVCNLCNTSIQFVLKHEKNNTLKFASLQSDFAQKLLQKNNLKLENFDTILYVEKEQIFSKSKAVFKIAKELKFPFSFIRYFNFLPNFFIDYFYDIISKNRYRWFGKKEICFIPDKNISNRFF